MHNGDVTGGMVLHADLLAYINLYDLNKSVTREQNQKFFLRNFDLDFHYFTNLTSVENRAVCPMAVILNNC